MTARLGDMQGMPDWPRGLSEEQAAAYVGVSVGTFRWEVEQGIWPKPDPRGPKEGRNIWDRKLLDQAYDKRSNLDQARKAGAASGDRNDWMGTLPGGKGKSGLRLDRPT